jgi:hypothetical protein
LIFMYSEDFLALVGNISWVAQGSPEEQEPFADNPCRLWLLFFFHRLDIRFCSSCLNFTRRKRNLIKNWN